MKVTKMSYRSMRESPCSFKTSHSFSKPAPDSVTISFQCLGTIRKGDGVRITLAAHEIHLIASLIPPEESTP